VSVRQRILRATLEVIGEHGIGGVTNRAVAAAWRARRDGQRSTVISGCVASTVCVKM